MIGFFASSLSPAVAGFQATKWMHCPIVGFSYGTGLDGYREALILRIGSDDESSTKLACKLATEDWVTTYDRDWKDRHVPCSYAPLISNALFTLQRFIAKISIFDLGKGWLFPESSGR